MGIPSLIPYRLFAILGDICASHTKDFDEVLKIPFEEKGMGGDVAHPRMIACLLRLGDVLDIDNNRFDPSALAFVGKENIPEDSRLHIRKHLSITHFQVDEKRIELQAQVNIHEKNGDPEDFDDRAYQVAEETNKWFDYIRSEFANQKQHIGIIYPKEFGIKLPELDIQECRLGGNYIYLNKHEKPEFQINPKQAFELLRGMNLYEAPWQSIRELIQNAIDASLIRYWVKSKNMFKENLSLLQQQIAKLKENEKYGITIDIKENTNSYIFCIKDNGIGFSKNDLQYLLKVGSAKDNRQKKELIKDMPDWIRPSGNFGIGFQSIFILTDWVIINTQNLITREHYNIKLFSPLGNFKGGVLVKKAEPIIDKPCFTEIKFLLKKSTIHKHSIGGDFLQAITSESFNNQQQDLFSDFSKDIGVNAIMMEIQKYVQYSIFPIKFNINNKNFSLESKSFDKKGKSDSNLIKVKTSSDVVFCQVDYEFYNEDRKNLYAGQTVIFFKNQYVCNYDNYALPYINESTLKSGFY